MTHIPVLLKEVLNTLGDIDGKTIVDGTFGAGGYTKSFLEKKANVIAFDKDSSVEVFTEKLKNTYKNKFTFINDSFANIKNYVMQADAFVFDFGVSSMQLDDANRGFSFRFDSRLDMRMNEKQKVDAISLMKNKTLNELKSILYEYGNVKNAYGIAKAIKLNQPTTTFELKKLIYNKKDINNVFQAIRIAVNNELEEIKKMLISLKELLQKDNILICVTFNSTEDRIIKNTFNSWLNKNDYLPIKEEYKILKTYKPSEEEIINNNRSRSAHLRAIQKL